MRLRSFFCVVVFLVLSSGCATVIKSQYHAVKQTMVGEYYLDSKNTKRGIEVFREEVRTHPDNAEAYYYLGRFLLAEKNKKEALNYLKRAVELSPKKADYHFWLGVAYAANKRGDLEKKSYLRALEIDKKHVQALMYLGHNQLERKKYREALKSYSKVLEIRPANPSALYNRAFIMKRLGRTPEEKLAWKEYLAYYQSGAMARRAVLHLNDLGDFEYRNYLIGRRRISLETIKFKPFTAKIMNNSRPSLNFLGNILKNNKDVSIHVVAYQKNNKELAEARTKSVKKYIIKKFKAIKPSRLTVSWFDVPERIKIGKKIHRENETINFITAR